MNPTHKWTAALLVVIALGLLTYIGKRLPGQLDLTADQIYTLSPASIRLIADLEEPVSLRFYFSRGAGGLPVRFKNYATRVEDLLRQYAARSGGRIRLEVIDPRPDTPEEEAAIRAGLNAQPLVTGEQLYFGLEAIQADNIATIGFFTNDREAFLEHDISQLIFQVRQLDKPVLGLLTALPVDGDFDPARGQQTEPWVFLQQLRGTYTVERIQDDTIPATVDVLLLLHPEEPATELLYAIDQFLLSGRPLLVILDPSSQVQRAAMSRQAMMMGMPPGAAASNLPRLLQAWGIDWDTRHIVADPALATSVTVQPGAPPVPFSAWLTLRDFDTANPLLSQLNELLLPEAGAFVSHATPGLTWEPLLSTGPSAGLLPASALMFAQPGEIDRRIEQTGLPRTVAGILRGTFPSAFPEGPPAAASGDADGMAGVAALANAAHRATGQSTVLLIGDSDFLSDDFSVRVMNLFGMRAATPINDNLGFLLNAIDSLAGYPELLALRGKGGASRTFTRVEAIERAAQTAYREQLDLLDQRLAAVQARIRDLQQGQEQRQMLVATPETLAAIDEFRKEEAEVRAQQREIRKKLREDIEALNRRLALFNLLTMPLLLGAGGCLFFWRRHRRR